MIQYGRYSPRPYTRINLISGTKGTLVGDGQGSRSEPRCPIGPTS